MKDLNIYKKSSITKKWFVIDAKEMVLGRIAARIAVILKGKHKASYAPNMDCGDNVVVVNAKDVHLSGNKLSKKNGKIYYRHTGYPGGLKTTTAYDVKNGKYPERLLKMCVKGMLKKGALREKIMGNLYVYSGHEHKHEAQKPVLLNLSSENPKNQRR